MLDRTIAVRFDANVMGGLPWKFEPEKTEINVRIGEVVTAYYTVTNLAARPTLGQASYNVTPLTAGIHFQKINCFCFTEQRFAPGEKREMAVVFYVDPALAADAEHDQLIDHHPVLHLLSDARRAQAGRGAGHRQAQWKPVT